MQPQNLKNTVVFDKEAVDSLLQGAEVVYKAVSSTLGPASKLVAINQPFGNPTTVGDGVTVAKAIVRYGLEDDNQDTGAKLLVMASEGTNNSVGDGTTTTIVLAYEIFKTALTAIENGANAMALRKGINLAVKEVCKYLDSIKVEITNKQLKQVASISAQNEELGEMIADAFSRLGKNGVITVEESSGTDIFIEFKEGMEFDKGYLSNYFVTNPESNEASIVDPYILVTDHKLNSNEQLIGFLQNFVQNVAPEKKNIVIICDGAEPICLATCVAQKLKGVMNILVVQAPGNQDHRVDLLQDIAVSTGAVFVSKEAKMMLKDVKIEHLGTADHITASDKTTVIVDGQANEKQLQDRVVLLTDRKDHPDTDAFSREKITERLAKLTSGIGIIRVGGLNEAEISEMRERAIDAVSATKAGLEDGVIAGGETGLLNAGYQLTNYTNPATDEEIGYMIVREACKEPFRKLLTNSHLDLELEQKSVGKHGVDVISGEVTDLVKAGILDPVKVPKTALLNASSVANQLLSTSVIIGVKVISKDETD